MSKLQKNQTSSSYLIFDNLYTLSEAIEESNKTLNADSKLSPNITKQTLGLSCIRGVNKFLSEIPDSSSPKQAVQRPEGSPAKNDIMAKIHLIPRDMDARMAKALYAEFLGTLLFQFFAGVSQNPLAGSLSYAVLGEPTCNAASYKL